MREIRSSGSVRGVRSDPYPYRDEIHPVRKHRALLLALPKTPDGAPQTASRPGRRLAVQKQHRRISGGSIALITCIASTCRCYMQDYRSSYNTDCGCRNNQDQRVEPQVSGYPEQFRTCSRDAPPKRLGA